MKQESKVLLQSELEKQCSHDELRLAISRLNNNLTLVIKLGNNARNAYKFKYDWSLMEIGVIKYYQIIMMNFIKADL